jgi:hypothetical protein
MLVKQNFDKIKINDAKQLIPRIHSFYVPNITKTKINSSLKINNKFAAMYRKFGNKDYGTKNNFLVKGGDLIFKSLS